MFKRLAVCFFTLLICQHLSTFAANHSSAIQSAEPELAQISCVPKLQPLLAKIQQLPEARQLLATIQKEGPLRIVVNNTPLSEQFGAFWDPDNRIISISMSAQRPEGALIGSMLFEMHNAAINSKLEHYDHLATAGKIDKENYVRAIEHLEYQNSLNASKIATLGIQAGIFPPEAHLPTYRDFEEHYRFQKLGGHSACIAQNYEYLLSAPSSSQAAPTALARAEKPLPTQQLVQNHRSLPKQAIVHHNAPSIPTRRIAHNTTPPCYIVQHQAAPRTIRHIDPREISVNQVLQDNHNIIPVPHLAHTSCQAMPTNYMAQNHSPIMPMQNCDYFEPVQSRDLFQP